MATTCPLKNKDFYGTIQYDQKDDTGFPFHGHIIGTDMKYNGRTAQDLVDSFHLTVEQCADTSRQFPLPRMVKACEIDGMLHDFSTVINNDILPALRANFDRFLRKPAEGDNCFPSSWYNLHRLVQHAKSILFDHLDKFGIMACGVPVYLPEFIPDIPECVLTLDFGNHTDSYKGGLRSLRSELSSLVGMMDTSNLCSATLEEMGTDGRPCDEFTVQFPDIL